MNTKRLYAGTVIPTTINTSERIFQVQTYDGEAVLCNLDTAQLLIRTQICKGIKHLWDNKFQVISKGEVKSMPAN